MRTISAALIAILPASAHADPAGVTALCLDAGGTEAMCICATSALQAQIGDGIDVYGRIGESYLARRDGGLPIADAWDAALREEAGRQGVSAARLMNRTNKIGQAHSAAIQSCSR